MFALQTDLKLAQQRIREKDSELASAQAALGALRAEMNRTSDKLEAAKAQLQAASTIPACFCVGHPLSFAFDAACFYHAYFCASCVTR